MTINALLLGAIAATCLFISLILVRFWRTTHDRFFLLFGLSFLVEGVSRVCLALVPLASELEPVFYTVRLIVFLIIIFAIVDKNLRNNRSD